jgi:hypothetical protein
MMTTRATSGEIELPLFLSKKSKSEEGKSSHLTNRAGSIGG